MSIGPALGQTMATSTTTFTDDTGFTVGVPQGWLAVDDNNTIDTVAKAEAELGFIVLAEFCPEDQGQFLTSGTPFCGDAEHRIYVHRYKILLRILIFSPTSVVVTSTT